MVKVKILKPFKLAVDCRTILERRQGEVGKTESFIPEVAKTMSELGFAEIVIDDEVAEKEPVNKKVGKKK